MSEPLVFKHFNVVGKEMARKGCEIAIYEYEIISFFLTKLKDEICNVVFLKKICNCIMYRAHGHEISINFPPLQLFTRSPPVPIEQKVGVYKSLLGLPLRQSP